MGGKGGGGGGGGGGLIGQIGRGMQALWPASPARQFSEDVSGMVGNLLRHDFDKYRHLGYKRFEKAMQGRFDPATAKGVDAVVSALRDVSPGITSTEFQRQMAPMAVDVARRHANLGMSENQMNQLMNDVMQQVHLSNLQQQQRGALGASQFLGEQYAQLGRESDPYKRMQETFLTYAPMSGEPSEQGFLGRLGGAVSAFG